MQEVITLFHFPLILIKKSPQTSRSLVCGVSFVVRCFQIPRRGRCPHRPVPPLGKGRWLGEAETERSTCLRRPNLFPCVGKDWGEKDAVRSKTAITYRLKKGTAHPDRPFCLSKKPNRKLGLRFGKEETNLENKKHRSAMIRFGKVVSDAHAIVGDGGVGALKLAMCACGRREPYSAARPASISPII